MQRIEIDARRDWQTKVEAQGFPFHSGGVRPTGETGTYWYEQAYYRFTAKEVDVLEAATEELHLRCLDAVEYVCRNRELLTRLGIPREYHAMVQRSWHRKDPTVYGRFDLAYDGVNSPKMLEYNADTPTTAVETAVVQWYWLNDVFPKNRPDQFCSIHEKLIEHWRSLKPRMVSGSVLYFASIRESLEEFATVEYLRDTTNQAGLLTKFIFIDELRWNYDLKKFVDTDGTPIDYIFKLYPWGWMFKEEFGKFLIETHQTTGFIEPPWKAVLSNKGILPILWELFPEHPNLLPAFWNHDSRLGDEWIAKPTLGREGCNMILKSKEIEMETVGIYGEEPKIYQKLFHLPRFDAQYATIGSWIIGDKSAGMCIREDDKPIIVNSSRLVPHVFE